jgi:hydroxymethylpyrimidine pyrophosphatase-like HAD family hydrolase
LKDPKAIIVIPGYYDDKAKQFKHSLATGYAVKQWGNKIYSDEIKDIIEQKITAMQVRNPRKVFFGNIGTETVKIFNNDGSLKRTFYPQFPVGAQTWDDFEKKFSENIKNMSEKDKKALITNYETNLNFPDFSIANPLYHFKSDQNKLDDILQHLKNTYQDNKFIHVWGSNNDNWNNDLGQWGGGDGQATAFKANQDGVFALATTPVKGTKNLMDKCKIYGAPSAHPLYPQALVKARGGVVAEAGLGH